MSENKEQRCREVRKETLDAGIYMNIFSRLPVKCICSFKLVSKFWYGMIREKYFAKRQVTQSRENPTFLTCPTKDPIMTLYSMKAEGYELRKLNTINAAERCQGRGHGHYMFMISSFNGLICCINHMGDNKSLDLQIWICNPCTGETLVLPKGTPSYGVEPSFGVTYASDTSDYKVFRIFGTGKKLPEQTVPTVFGFGKGRFFTGNWYAMNYECEVYSSITRSWKKIGPVHRAPMHFGENPQRWTHAFAGGKLFWLVSVDVILSMDSSGNCEDVRLPHYDHKLTNLDCIFLTVLQGSLSLVIVRLDYKTIDVWVWEEEKKDWSKLRTGDGIPIPFHGNVLAVTTLKSQILFVTDTFYWKYDVDTGEWETKAGPPGIANPSVLPFTESLLRCKGGMML
ncbi:unnamed protein product [Cochlearia groenlandica]